MNSRASEVTQQSSESAGSIPVGTVIVIFAVAYAIVLFAIGFIPINLLLKRLLGPSIMSGIWMNTVIQLVERTAVAALACWVVLLLTGRGRGRLTGRGMLGIGVAMSGALAAAADVGLHKLLVRHIIAAARTSQWLGHAASGATTAVVAAVIALLFVVRSMKSQAPA